VVWNCVYGPNYMGDTSLHIGTGTTAVAVTPDQNIVYMGTVNNEVIPVSVIPGVNYLTVGTPIQVGYDPDALAISPNGQTLWVANAGSDTVQPIDIASATAGSAISVGDDPDALAIAPNGKTLYVANYDSGSVTPVSTVTDTAGTAIPVGAAPQALAITPDQGPIASFSDTTANLGTATTFNATGSTTPERPSSATRGTSVTVSPTPPQCRRSATSTGRWGATRPLSLSPTLTGRRLLMSSLGRRRT
jgi:YVTN family beta-propeller protein